MSFFSARTQSSLRKSSINMQSMNSRIQLELEPQGETQGSDPSLGCVIFGLRSVFSSSFFNELVASK